MFYSLKKVLLSGGTSPYRQLLIEAPLERHVAKPIYNAVQQLLGWLKWHNYLFVFTLTNQGWRCGNNKDGKTQKEHLELLVTKTLNSLELHITHAEKGLGNRALLGSWGLYCLEAGPFLVKTNKNIFSIKPYHFSFITEKRWRQFFVLLAIVAMDLQPSSLRVNANPTVERAFYIIWMLLSVSSLLTWYYSWDKILHLNLELFSDFSALFVYLKWPRSSASFTAHNQLL